MASLNRIRTWTVQLIHEPMALAKGCTWITLLIELADGQCTDRIVPGGQLVLTSLVLHAFVLRQIDCQANVKPLDLYYLK